MAEAAFSINKLNLAYGKTSVIKDLTCEIAKGKITYIIGGNGAGKSTLIKALIGRHPLQSGTIKVFGEANSSANIAKYIGYVPQYSNIDRTFPITVDEMIALECGEPDTCKVGISGHLHIFDAEKLLHKKISDLSGGELQKTLIARALVSNPEILILDEPFNNLDHETEVDLIELLRKLHDEQGKTIIFVTHDLGIINIKDSDTLYLTHGAGHIGNSEDILNQHQLNKI